MAIWDFLLKINGVDSETYGFYPESLGGPWDTPEFAYDEQQVPEHDGPVRTSDDPELQPKEFKIAGTLLKDTETNLENALDDLKFALSAHDLTIIVGNRETRQRVGRLVGAIGTVTNGDAITEVRLEFTVRCVDPIARDTSAATPITGSAGVDRDIPLGTWRSWPVITHTTPTSPLTETYKDKDGNTKGTPTVTFPGSPTTVVVDHGNRTITVDGVRHDEYLTAGDFFCYDPRDGDRNTNLPTIRWSSGTASSVHTNNWL